MASGYKISIQGQVQGLGFRPHVYRLAKALDVRGFVANSNLGVVIEAQGKNARRFTEELRLHPPPLAVVTSFRVSRAKLTPCLDFVIRPSRAEKGAGVDVLPDLAICPACRREIADPANRRHGYAFTNCTQCGPRYTIIEHLPYDRPHTTMARFRMCPDCRREYTEPGDRRYHAQPIACPVCGPRLTVSPASARLPPVEAAAQALLGGRIVAIKSLGGFQLACDATNDSAVGLLRRRKRRPAKPFALMCENVTAARKFCRVSPAAQEVMLSAAAPIVLLPKSPRPALHVADAVAPRNSRLGVMLPYTPLHAVLFERMRLAGGRPAVLVMTSANRKENPIVAEEGGLGRELPNVPDLVLSHNRPIANRCDDSVVLAEAERESPLVFVRRSRGYAPQPLPLGRMFHVKRPVLAVGGEFKNTFALAGEDRAFLSPHVGTVETAEGEAFWLETFARYAEWTGIEPALVAADLHPDYASTRLAERLARDLGLPLVRVQHHYAHVLSVMAEHDLRSPVLGLAFDGTGYGPDGAVWGGEFLLVHDRANWQRVGHLGYLGLADAGAELANPSRVARTYLAQAKDRLALRSRGQRAVSRRLPLTSSVGRLFDAAAAITGACRTASFDGEAPAALEALADPRERKCWPVDEVLDLSVSPALLPEPIILRVARETAAGVAPAAIAARFHNTLSRAAVRLAEELCSRYGVATVCLSGGSFQNSWLRRQVIAGLRSFGRNVYWNRTVPLNDGGVAYGQAAATAWVP
ncbi:carbamoyltransferase HypF [candidate division WOR-3 bacterium]|nr:carbamoyltransferase HypF [candidate division WOR-3 bacterium]